MIRARVLDVVRVEEVYSHAVLLCDEQNRVLPIFVGPAEAISTAMSLKWGHIERPLTYKLIANLIHTFMHIYNIPDSDLTFYQTNNLN